MGGIDGRMRLVAAVAALGVGLVACGGAAPGSAGTPQPPAATAPAGSVAPDPGTGAPSASPEAPPSDAGAQPDPGAAKVCDSRDRG